MHSKRSPPSDLTTKNLYSLLLSPNVPHTPPISLFLISHILLPTVVWIAQSVQRLATGWTVRGSNPGGARFSAPVQTDPGAHPASCTMGTGSLTGVESGRGVTLTPHPLLVPRSKNRVGLYNSTLRKGLRGLYKRVKPTANHNVARYINTSKNNFLVTKSWKCNQRIFRKRKTTTSRKLCYFKSSVSINT
jgi:hypothetical protein